VGADLAILTSLLENKLNAKKNSEVCMYVLTLDDRGTIPTYLLVQHTLSHYLYGGRPRQHAHTHARERERRKDSKQIEIIASLPPSSSFVRREI